jgi:preprotein translocase subunit SecY
MNISKNLLNRILITFAAILVFRLLSYVSVPGVDTDLILAFFDTNKSNALGMMNMFSGNAVERFSIVALGVMPYITASIIMELLAYTYQPVKNTKETDMKKYTKNIKLLTVGLTFLQAIGVTFGLTQLVGLNGQSAILIDPTMFGIIAGITMTVGTMILLWLGEKITQLGIGNGVSIIIFAGIISGLPRAISGTVEVMNNGTLSFLSIISVIAFIALIISVIIMIEQAERRIPVHNKKQISSGIVGRPNFVPIKVNIPGVIPVIFASAILMMPTTFIQGSTNDILIKIGDFLNPATISFNILMFILVVFFSFFYASISFNAKKISEDLSKQGNFIPGIRQGEGTEIYLKNKAAKLTIFASLYLGVISTVPLLIVQSLGVPFYFGGIAALIVVNVAIDVYNKIESEKLNDKYNSGELVHKF